MPKTRRERRGREGQTQRRRRRSSPSALMAPGTFVPFIPTYGETQENPQVETFMTQRPLVWQNPQVGRPNDRGSDHRRVPPRSSRPPGPVPQENYTVFPQQSRSSSLPISMNVVPTGSVDLSSLDISSTEMSPSMLPSTEFLPTPDSGGFRGHLPESEVSNYQEDPHPAQQWPELQSPDSSTSYPYVDDASLLANTYMAETSSNATFFSADVFGFGDRDIFLTPSSSPRMSTSLVLQQPDSNEFSLPSFNDET